MPNWVNTMLEITGPEEDLKRFRDSVKVVEREVDVHDYSAPDCPVIGTRIEKDLQILEAFVPCPPELYEIVSPVRAEQADLAAEMLDKHGATDWYAWQYDNWGVKWGDCRTTLDNEEVIDGQLVYRFETPWGAAEVGFMKVSALFPTLRFQFYYDEEAGFFAGAHVMRNGEILFEEMFAPCEYEGEIDWDDEESALKYDAWKLENQDRIESEADMVV